MSEWDFRVLAVLSRQSSTRFCGVKRVPLRALARAASLVRFLKLSLTFGSLIDNFCPGFVLQLFPLPAFVLGTQATFA
jgi:hypothetical protein